jgi:hypothetical protein
MEVSKMENKNKYGTGVVVVIAIMALLIGVLAGVLAMVIINTAKPLTPAEPMNNTNRILTPAEPMNTTRNIVNTCNDVDEPLLNNNYINTNTNTNNQIDWNMIDKKPIIYLYPQEKTELTVTLGKPENLTCSYPEYKDGWNVIANPDGTLVDKENGRELYSLYWEGLQTEPVNMEEGFVVKGTDTAKFLEEKLAILGLTDKEAEEFIVYWLPELQNNEYNYIRFATIEEINANMPLDFSVNPDTLIRVLMQYKPLDEKIEVREQKLETPARNGFVAVEWGGTEIK